MKYLFANILSIKMNFKKSFCVHGKKYLKKNRNNSNNSKVFIKCLAC